MKSKYTFEKMELDGEIVAVPVGKGAADFRAVLYVNEEAMRILELLQKETAEQDILKQLVSEYASTKEEIYPLVHAYIEQLRKEELLEE